MEELDYLNKYLESFNVEIDQLEFSDPREVILGEVCQSTSAVFDHRPMTTNKSVHTILTILHEKLLEYRWDDAAAICASLTHYNWKDRQDNGLIETSHILWRVGNHLSKHLAPTASDADGLLAAHQRAMNCYHERADHTHALLERVFSMLLAPAHDDNVAPACDALRFFDVVPKQLRCKGKRVARIEQWRSTVHAYIGLIEHAKWEHAVDGAADDAEAIAERAVEHLQKAIAAPGCWDLFVLKLISLQQRRRRRDELERDLRAYGDARPDNPNAHVYLAEFLLEKDDGDADQLIDCLRKLHAVDPSHALNLRLADALLETRLRTRTAGAADVLTESAEAVMGVLDYPRWTSSREPWLHLLQCLEASERAGVMLLVRRVVWKESGRGTWWPRCRLAIDSRSGVDAAREVKSKVAKMLASSS